MLALLLQLAPCSRCLMSFRHLNNASEEEMKEQNVSSSFSSMKIFVASMQIHPSQYPCIHLVGKNSNTLPYSAFCSCLSLS